MSFYILIRGPLGCGKSTISKSIAKRLNAGYFPVDKILKEHKLEDDWEDGYISQENFKKANKIIATKAYNILKSGTPAIIDGNFYWKSQIRDMVKRLDFPHQVFTLKVPLDICIERDSKRGKPHGRSAAEEVYKKTAEFDCGTVIDANKPLKECVDAVLFFINQKIKP